MALNIPILSSLDAKGFEKAQRQFEMLQTTSQKTGFILKKAFLPAVAALSGLAAIGAKTASMASDLNEETSKTGIIFGDASASVIEFSKTAAKSLGQSQTEALKAAGTFGVLGQAAGLTGTDLKDMALKFTTLATDLASFNNTSPEDAVLALGAGLRGEAEPLRRYGILLNDATLRQKALELGLIKTTTEALSPQNKTLAAQAVILEKSSLQQGNFALTAGDAANQQRIMTAEIKNAQINIGKGFLPVMVAATGLLSVFANFAGKNAPLIITLAFAIGTLSAAIVLVNAAMKAFKAIAVITTGVNYALSTSFTAVQIATGIGIVTALAGVAAFIKIKSSMENATGAAVAYGEALLPVIANQKQLNEFVGPVASRDFDTFKRIARQNAIETDKLAIADTKAADAKAKLKAAAKALAQELVKLKDALRDQMAAALEKANTVLDEAVAKFDAFASSVSDAVKSSYSFGNAQNSATQNTEALADASADVAKAQKEVAKAIAGTDPEALATAYEDLAEANKKLNSAQSAPMTFLENLREQANKVKDFGVLINRLLAAGISPAALQQVVAAGADAGSLIANELLNTAGGVLEANALTADVNSVAETVGQNSAAQFFQAGVTAGQNLVNGIQSVVDGYTIRIPGATTAEEVGAIAGGFATDVGAVMAGPTAPIGGYTAEELAAAEALAAGLFGDIPLLAAGGIVTAPTLAMIGEGNGPEAVIPLNQMGNYSGGGGMNITVQAGLISTPDQIGQQIIEAIQRAQRRSGTVFAPA
jgi:hypothetical protein